VTWSPICARLSNVSPPLNPSLKRSPWLLISEKSRLAKPPRTWARSTGVNENTPGTVAVASAGSFTPSCASSTRNSSVSRSSTDSRSRRLL
jgi:hypothetical protein